MIKPTPAKTIPLISRLLKPYILIPLIFALLAIRNWPVFLLADLRDGLLVKLLMVEEGLGWQGFKHYAKHYALSSWVGHFKPVWFFTFFGIVYLFDSNPWVLGALSFGCAAVLLYLIFRIIAHFYGNVKNGLLYAALVTLAFSSTSFFLETIAWKWMLCLLLCSTFFCLALVILLEKLESKLQLKWILLYVVAMFASAWSFGSGWMLCWGLVVYLVLCGRKLRDRLLIVTIVATILAMLPTFIVNSGSTPPINIPFLVVNIPSTMILGAVNVVLQTLGVFRFAFPQFIRFSSVLAVTVIVALTAYYFAQYKNKKLSRKDALVAGLLISYVGIIALSFLRLAPSSGFTPISSPENYIIGGRYLFIYSVPLLLALAIAVGGKIVKLPRYLLVIFMGGFLLYGISMQLGYSQIDPDVSNRHRTDFYNLTPKALEEARTKSIVLPNISGDLYWRTYQHKLDRVIKIRKDSSQYEPAFKEPAALSDQECKALKESKYINQWLNLYSTEWCK